MNINFTVHGDRVQLDMAGLTRFTTMAHVISQAARNGARRCASASAS